MPTPSAYRVQYLWDGDTLDGLQIWQGGALCLDTTASEAPDVALRDLLMSARDYYRADPYSDALPPDYAIIDLYEGELT